MCAAGRVRGLLLQLVLERLQEYVEYVEVQSVRLAYDGAKLVLHQGRKDDRSGLAFGRCLVDFLHRLTCLVIVIYKWQSHLAKIMAIKLSQQAVAQRFRGNAGLIGQKEYGTLTHMHAFSGSLNPHSRFHVACNRLSISPALTQGS